MGGPNVLPPESGMVATEFSEIYLARDPWPATAALFNPSSCSGSMMSRMLAVGQDASRFLPEAKREFLGCSIVPAPDVPGADDISITELDLAPLERGAAIAVNTAKLLEETINDVDLQWTQNGDAALGDDGGGIEMTHGEIVQHHGSLSAIARRMRLAPSVIRSSVSAARSSASEWDTPCPSWYSWAITASQRSRRRALLQIDNTVGLSCLPVVETPRSITFTK